MSGCDYCFGNRCSPCKDAPNKEDDKILVAADKITKIFTEELPWLDPRRAAIIKILKELTKEEIPK